MTRIPPLSAREGLSVAQTEVYDAIVASRGSVRGPFPLLLHVPAIAAGAETMGGFLRTDGRLEPVIRESVVTLTASFFGCAVEWQAHSKLALEAGLDPALLRRIENWTLDDVAGDLGLALEFGRALLVEHRVPEPLFARASLRWSTAELVELASLVGYYSLLAMVLNAFDAK